MNTSPTLTLTLKMIMMTNNSPNLRWLRLNLLDNSVDNLEMTKYFLESLPGPIRWKWAIIALHQTLYGFAVCATKQTDSSWSLKKPGNPSSQLISIWVALKRAQDPEWIKSRIWNPLVLSEDERNSINKIIKNFRNEFEHFGPGSYSIEISGMPMLFLHVTRVIEHLALRTNNIIYSEKEVQKNVEFELRSLRDVLHKISSDYSIEDDDQ